MQGRAWGSSAAATAALIVPLLCRGRQARRLVSGRVSWRQRDGVCGVSASQVSWGGFWVGFGCWRVGDVLRK